jgi:hypothetical protein
MAESPQQPGISNKTRASNFVQAMVCWVLFLLGLGDLFDAVESGKTLKLVLSVLMIVCGGLGGLLSLWLALKKSA